MQCGHNMTFEELRRNAEYEKPFFLMTLAPDWQVKVIFLRDGDAKARRFYEEDRARRTGGG